MTLCTLSDVKTVLDITDTSQDSKLTLFISMISASVEAFIGYPMSMAVNTAEPYAINSNQLLYLRKVPVQSVQAVTIQGVTIDAGGDDGYQLNDTDALGGRLYRGVGWVGRYFTRDMTYDTVAGARDILISYTSGWYLPGDGGYVIGATASLPYGITSATIEAVVERYRMNLLAGEGLVMVAEGGLKSMLEQKSQPGGISSQVDGSGLSEIVQGKLNPWRRRIIA